MPRKNTRQGLTVEQLPSGSWRTRTHGRSFTGATKKEVLEKAMKYKDAVETGKRMPAGAKTLGQLVEDYIAVQTTATDSKGVSPSTLRGYIAYHRNMFTDLQGMHPYEITQAMAQAAVNREAAAHSAKYIKNSWNLLHRAADFYGEELPRVSLPKVVDKELSWVQKADMSAFLAAVEEEQPQLQICFLLALHSLRLSEILGLKWDDFDPGCGAHGAIRVRGALVQGADGWVYKEETKNSTSYRTVPIVTPRLTDLLRLEHTKRTDDVIIHWRPSGIQAHLDSVCERAGIRRVTMHDLRRTFASTAYGVLDEMTTMRIGGWKDIYTMRKNYTRMSEQEIFEKSAALTEFYT